MKLRAWLDCVYTLLVEELQTQGRGLSEAIKAANDLLLARPPAEKTREEKARENAAAMATLQNMMSGARLQ